jgi:aspartyl-tRNA(Asn)/glutamyl-tRNA(Gln) amidotransferase subunit A
LSVDLPNPGNLSLTAIARSAQRGDVSATELVEAALVRIAMSENTLSCFLELRADEALAEARRLDKTARARAPLHGVPIAVKDNLLVTGMHARAGSPLLDGRRRNRTATAVQRLRRAGAIVIGHSNMYELAFGAQNPRWPATPNPRNLAFATAGSSSGSAAAVSAGLVLAAVATDTGGSIRVPASFCGVVGLRPTPGIVSRRGLIRLSRLDQVGPITRTVGDAGLLHRVLAGRSPAVASRGQEVVRVAVPPFVDTNADVQDAIERFCDQLRGIGIAVNPAAPLPFQDAAEALWTIASVDAARQWLEDTRKPSASVHPIVRQRIAEGAKLDLVALRRAIRLRDSVRHAVLTCLKDADLLVMPAAACAGYRLAARTVETPRGDEDVSSAVTRYTPLASVAGMPALVLPCGTGREGLPIGVQLLARPHEEETLFAVGARLEAAHRDSSALRSPESARNSSRRRRDQGGMTLTSPSVRR